MQFHWRIDREPPLIEGHSKAKLTVLRQYLIAYFDRLNSNPHREQFKLSLVDGFCGGGEFLDANEVVPGSPIIMLDESEKARVRLQLNRSRMNKFNLDCKYYFVDAKKSNTDYLREVLRKFRLEHKCEVDENMVVIKNDKFENVVEDIVRDIKDRQPKTGRAIFLLDQTGFAQVHLEIVAQIFRKLPAAEVILTFAADALINHLSCTPALIKAVAPLALKEEHIVNLLEQKDSGGRALIQRTLREHIRMITGAAYDTPFFIRPRKSRRALWFVHLANHPIARDVMMQQHWAIPHTFAHYGTCDFQMLGWDEILDSGTPPLIQFKEHEVPEMRRRILTTIMPEFLYGRISESPITVDGVRHLLANKTPARFGDLDQVLLTLFQEREIDVITPDNRVRSRTLRHLKPTDRIALPKILLFPGISRQRIMS